jgi:hypothetical protein
VDSSDAELEVLTPDDDPADHGFDPDEGNYALVIGNPWASAFAIEGSPEDLRAFTSRLSALVRLEMPNGARSDPAMEGITLYIPVSLVFDAKTDATEVEHDFYRALDEAELAGFLRGRLAHVGFGEPVERAPFTPGGDYATDGQRQATRAASGSSEQHRAPFSPPWPAQDAPPGSIPP